MGNIIPNMYDSLADAMAESFEGFTPLMENTMIDRAVDSMFDRVVESIYKNMPYDYYQDKNDNVIIQISVVGKTKDDVELTTDNMPNGNISLMIKVNGKTNEEFKDFSLIDHHLKSGEMSFRFTLSSKLDTDTLTAEIKDGLMTIRINAKKEQSNFKKHVIK